ncbi:MAG: DUF2332 domain-containing protein, partial [Ktedonobacteraceae bacterium]
MSFSLNDPRNWLDVVPKTLHASPLYSALWERMKDDAEILALMDLIEKDQPLPITFFTAINYLVLGEPQDPLAQFYPYLQPEHTQPAAEAYPFFRAFVLAHQEVLQALLPTARLQTNEVTRCANLLPAFLLTYRHGGYQALNMIELGSSAGLNLLWNQYGYRYQYENTPSVLDVVGDPKAPVQLQCLVTPAPRFPITSLTTLPYVAQCQGIEICPRDLDEESDRRWVRAAIWPEELARHRLLDAAIAFAERTPVVVHQGDACDLLPELLAAIPRTQTAVVWHSYALNQGPLTVKTRIEEQIAEASQRMPIY